jgi:hypothetical protein
MCDNLYGFLVFPSSQQPWINSITHKYAHIPRTLAGQRTCISLTLVLLIGHLLALPPQLEEFIDILFSKRGTTAFRNHLRAGAIVLLEMVCRQEWWLFLFAVMEAILTELLGRTAENYDRLCMSAKLTFRLTSQKQNFIVVLNCPHLLL